ncbi:MAG TPA: isoprenylcysteine carboxylmethyltransferase family protein [bacterium]|nr:isoprenylcysteine carboxylmethyltransferase family protein [bacterium]
MPGRAATVETAPPATHAVTACARSPADGPQDYAVRDRTADVARWRTMPLLFKAIANLLFWMSFFAAVLFVPAGTGNWWRGWVFLGVLGAGMVYAVASLLPVHRDLVEERLKLPIQREQPLTDKIVVTLFYAAFYGLVAFIPLDVFRFDLLGAPGPLVSSLGLALFVAGWVIAYLALRENAFAATAVKHLARQTVVDTGVYGVVRHPMYAGGIPMLIGMPLWLGSYASALLALVPIATVVVRALLEERFLRRELPGYVAYAERVRYRLVPFLW